MNQKFIIKNQNNTKYIVGRSGSGKTEYVLKQIKELLNKKDVQNIVIIDECNHFKNNLLAKHHNVWFFHDSKSGWDFISNNKLSSPLTIVHDNFKYSQENAKKWEKIKCTNKYIISQVVDIL